jgi:hypothetical protein
MHLDSGIRTLRPEIVLFFDGGVIILNVLFLESVIGLALQFVERDVGNMSSICVSTAV